MNKGPKPGKSLYVLGIVSPHTRGGEKCVHRVEGYSPIWQRHTAQARESIGSNPITPMKLWRDGRIGEGTGLENQRTQCPGGSNPPPSASLIPLLGSRAVKFS